MPIHKNYHPAVYKYDIKIYRHIMCMQIQKNTFGKNVYLVFFEKREKKPTTTTVIQVRLLNSRPFLEFIRVLDIPSGIFFHIIQIIWFLQANSYFWNGFNKATRRVGSVVMFLFLFIYIFINLLKIDIRTVFKCLSLNWIK